MNKLKFGSVCSGIEAASVAWHPLGWEAAWLAEIEPFPSAVLKHHYPDVPNYGDMTALPDRIRNGEVDAPDLFCGGTPCQAFSVAGKRQSLADARGNLSLTFCDIADAIDESRSVRGLPATIVFWENVPGVLSTGDNAFGCFLAQLCGGDEPLYAPDGWPDAGCVSGPSRTAAWRVLDAQYFGLAQRRRRVFVVASAREGFDPAAVLFEFNGVRRDTAPSREAGQRVANALTDRADRGGTNSKGQRLIPQIVGALTSASGNAVPGNTVQDAMAGQLLPLIPSITGTLTAQMGNNPMGAPEVDDGMYLPVKTYSTPAIGHIVPDEIASTITKNSGSGGETQNPAFVMQPVTYDFFNITAPVNGQNRKPGDPCHTLARSNAEHAMVIGFDAYNNTATGDIAKTLDVGQDHHHVPLAFHPTQTPISSENVCHSISSGNGQTPVIAWDEELNATIEQAGTLLRGGDGGRHDGVLAPTLTASNDPSRSPQSSEITAQVAAVFEATAAVAFQIGPQSGEFTDVAPTLDCRAKNGPIQNQLGAGVMQAMQVRRLTPVECERLQGFPDNYTAIPWRGKDVDNCPDGPRYKALGNSWAVPVVQWIGKRIQENL